MRLEPWRRGSGRGWRWFGPFEGFASELLATGAGEFVVAGFAIVVGGAPFGGDVAFLFELEEGRIESAVIDREEVAAGLLDAAGDAIAVDGAQGFESFQDHEGQSALPNVFFRGHAAPMGKQ